MSAKPEKIRAAHIKGGLHHTQKEAEVLREISSPNKPLTRARSKGFLNTLGSPTTPSIAPPPVKSTPTSRNSRPFPIYQQESSSVMSHQSQNRGRGRNNPRSNGQEAGEEIHIWKSSVPILQQLSDGEARAKEIQKELEILRKRELESGGETSIEDIEKHEQLLREALRITENQAAILSENGGELLIQLQVLKAMTDASEKQSTEIGGRASSSRATTSDFKGASDSPGPSSAENKHIRKVGSGRMSSVPPRTDTIRGDATPIEAAERPAGKPKITFDVGEEVAFKPKIAEKKEQDWIQGIVTRVIGEGKSRRYEVQDPAPDDNALALAKNGTVIYKSSASSMVPIPPKGTNLGPYEVGKEVLALYPDATTFYRAEVKAMLNGGASVQLLFEDEAEGAQKVVERRMVLDHKG